MYEDSDQINSDWFTKDRSESTSYRMPDRDFGYMKVKNLALGLNVYENAISSENCQKYIDLLESKLNGQTMYKWQEAQVTNSTKPIKSARNCSDFKYKPEHFGQINHENIELVEMHKEIYDVLKTCVDDYATYWGMTVVYYEAFNFVKYDGPGQQFRIHADHGPAYNCTVSAVIYLNDNYEGGELYFPRLDKLKYKPKVGDIVLCPSNYIYEHASNDIIKGTKYAVVVMTDINTLSHKEQNVRRHN
jgi:hypothetical protein